MGSQPEILTPQIDPKPAERLTLPMLKEYFLSGIKKPSDLQVGIEWEKIGVYEHSGEAIGYSGSRGVEAILRALVSQYGWKPVLAGKSIIALNKDKGSITLEPGDK